MIFPGFPGVLPFFQVFQVKWEPCVWFEKKTNAEFIVILAKTPVPPNGVVF